MNQTTPYNTSGTTAECHESKTITGDRSTIPTERFIVNWHPWRLHTSNMDLMDSTISQSLVEQAMKQFQLLGNALFHPQNTAIPKIIYRHPSCHPLWPTTKHVSTKMTTVTASGTFRPQGENIFSNPSSNSASATRWRNVFGIIVDDFQDPSQSLSTYFRYRDICRRIAFNTGIVSWAKRRIPRFMISQSQILPHSLQEQMLRWPPIDATHSIATIIDTTTTAIRNLWNRYMNPSVDDWTERFPWCYVRKLYMRFKINMNGNTAYHCIQHPCNSTTRSDGFARNKYNRNLRIHWISHSIFIDRWNLICINTFVDRHNTIVNPNFIQPQSQYLILQLLSGGEGETFLKHRVTMNPDV